MKKLLVLLILLPTVLPAQTRKGLAIGAQAAIGACDFMGELDKYAYGSHKGSYYEGAVQIGYLFTQHVGLFTGIGLNRYSYTFENANVDNLQVDMKMQQRYLTVPLMVHYVSSKSGSGRVGFFMQAGGAVQLLTGVSESGTLYGRPRASGSKDGYKKSNLELRTFFGLSIPVNRRIDLNVGPAFQITTGDQYKPGIWPAGGISLIGIRAGICARLGS